MAKTNDFVECFLKYDIFYIDLDFNIKGFGYCVCKVHDRKVLEAHYRNN